jgi:putative hydrolase of the HAD superfamily
MLIIFDLDDTLIDTSGSYQPFKISLALKAMIKSGLKVAEKDALNRLMQINQSAGNGKLTIKKFLEEIKWDKQLFDIGIKTYYGESTMGECKIKSLPHTLEVLEELSKEHILILVSYGDKKEQHNKLLSAGIKENWFKKIIITDKYNKTTYYRELLTKYAITPEKIIVCGDKYEGDLLPAKQLGMVTVHFRHGRGKINPPSLEDVSYSIDNIIKLKEIIKELK